MRAESSPSTPETPTYTHEVLPLHRDAIGLMWVFLGGCLGTAMRAGLIAIWPASNATLWAVFAANLAGAFILGLINSWFAGIDDKKSAHFAIKVCLGTGMCGAFTTYSTFISASAALTGFGTTSPNLLLALTYIAATLALGVLCAFLGLSCGKKLHGKAGRSS